MFTRFGGNLFQIFSLRESKILSAVIRRVILNAAKARITNVNGSIGVI